MNQLGRIDKRKVDNVFFYFVRSRDSNTTHAQSVEQSDGVKPSAARADAGALGGVTEIKSETLRDLLDTLSEIDRLSQTIIASNCMIESLEQKARSLRKVLESNLS